MGNRRFFNNLLEVFFYLSPDPTPYGVWQTNDGGKSWFDLPSYGASQRVVESRKGMMVQSSGDVAFADSLNGVSTVFGDGWPNSWYSGFSRTSDGGITWDSITPLAKAPALFGIYYQPSTHTYFGGPTSESVHVDSLFYISSDGWNTWKLSSCGFKASAKGLFPTGDIEGYGNAIYVEMNYWGDSAGVWRSLDGGNSFTYVNGPCSPPNDRFSVPPSCNGGIVVSAGSPNIWRANPVPPSDTGWGLWMTTDGGDGSLVAVGPPNITVDSTRSAVPCRSSALSISIRNIQCRGIMLDTALVNELDARGKFTLDTGNFPIYLDSGQTTTLHLHYSMMSPGHHTANIHIHGTNDGLFHNPYDTTFLLNGLGLPDTGKLSAPFAVKMQSPSVCFTIDSVIELVNTSCNTIQINSGSISPSQYAFDTLSYPIALAEGDSLKIHLHYSPTGPGTNAGALIFRTNTTPDSIVVQLHGSATISVPHLAGFPLDLGPTSFCAAADTILTLRNIGCDTLSLLDATLQLGKIFSLGTVSLPMQIPPDSTVQLHVIFAPHTEGTISDELVAIVSDHGKAISDTFAISGIGAYQSSLALTPAIAAGPISICTIDTLIATLINKGCDTLTASPTLSGAGYSFLRSDVSIPPGDTGKYLILFTPFSKSTATGRIDLRLRSSLTGVSFDTSVLLSTSVVSGSKVAAVDSNLRDLGMVNTCRVADTNIILENTGCDLLRVKSITLKGTDFLFLRGGQPVVLAPGQSDTIQLIYQPSNTGLSRATVTFYTDASEDSTITIPISAQSIGVQSLTLQTSLSRSNIPTGDTTTLFVTPSKTITVPGLTTLSCSIGYDGDLLTYIPNSVTVAPGFTVVAPIETRSGKLSTLKLTLNASANPTTFTKATTLASVRFSTTLTDSLSTPITLGNLKLNNGDSIFNNCTLSLADSNTNFTLALNCGDPTINAALRENLAFEIESITPNPTTGQLTVALRSNAPLGVTYELYDLLGHRVKQGTLTSSTNALALDGLQSGSYYLRLVGSGETITRRIVIQH